MKKHLFLGLSLTMALASCSNEEFLNHENGDSALKAVVETASSSRVGFDQANGWAFYWHQNDEIWVNGSLMSTEAPDKSAMGTFTGWGVNTASGYAVYPYSIAQKGVDKDNKLTYQFPASYEYEAWNGEFFGTKEAIPVIPMAAKVQNGTASFKHLGALFIIKFNQWDETGDHVFTLTSSKPITGEFTADLTADDPKFETTEGEGNNQVSFSFTRAEGAENEDLVFYIPVPTGTYNVEMKMTVGGDDKFVETKTGFEVNRADFIYAEFGKSVLVGGGTTIVSSGEELQTVLDRVEEGETITLLPGVNYGTLEIRPTKSNETTYKCDTHTDPYTDADAFIAHMAESGYHGTPTYTTTLKNVTIVGAEGATIEGFTVSSGHVYGDVYDYVREIDYDSGSAYYFTLNIESLTFKNVNFTGKVDIETSCTNSIYDGVTFEGCTFTTSGTADSNGAAIRYYNESNNGNVKNIKVDNCEFKNCYQGVYVHHVNGITVTGSTFDTTGHNAIAIQGHGDVEVDLKNVVITGNTFNNIGDRVIRFNKIGKDSNITIESNTATNSGDEDREIMKATSIAEGVTTSIKNNTWNGTVANAELKDLQ